jgi:pyruvate formate lyase activating enzyme
VKAAYLCRAMEDRGVQCLACAHFCRIAPGETGRCGVRENNSGRLFTRVYDRVVAAAVDPIEKKPLFHLLPGTASFSVATVGCNLTCRFCQNADIAQWPVDRRDSFPGRPMPPEEIVDQALSRGCKSISFTYTEPTVYIELALDTARLAKDKGLKTVFVSNGFMGPDLIDLVSPVLDAANVDLKAFSEDFYRNLCGARLDPVKKNLVRLREKGVMVEVTTLIIPGLNDDPAELEAMAGFIARDLGPDTPWHLSRFHPAHNLLEQPATPRTTLERAWDIGRAAGLYHVYTGNLAGGREDTHCHGCGALLVERRGYTTTNLMTEPGQCPRCRTRVYGIYGTD